MKQWIVIMIVSVLAGADNYYGLQYKGVESIHLNAKKYHIEREMPSNCLDIPISSATIWQGNYASEEVPEECKASFVKTVGVISAIKAAEGVETYGELEVLRFIRKMHHKKNNYLLVDSRGSEWYEYETIPGAVNFWYTAFKKPDVFPEEYTEMLQHMGVTYGEKGIYDFSKAKTLLLFCNGPWCILSPKFIKSLLKLGYPAEKLKWYRGGMHDWKSLSMTTTRSNGEVIQQR